MKRDFETVREYYDSAPEGEWERLESHPFEFQLTTWMMDKYIRPGDSVLDIGGGPGRYSIYYARKGCAVTLAELSGENVAFAKKKASEAGVSISAYAKNCLDLEDLRLGQFNHVFLMGPLYHLLDEGERVRAVDLALQHLNFFGQEGILAPNYRDILDRSREEVEQWVGLAKRYLEVPELLAFSEHAMYIGQKPS